MLAHFAGSLELVWVQRGHERRDRIRVIREREHKSRAGSEDSHMQHSVVTSLLEVTRGLGGVGGEVENIRKICECLIDFRQSWVANAGI